MSSGSAKIRINFVLPPVPRITGGPLAILEYAERLQARGYDVSVTTYPDIYWEGENPFPWFKFSGKIFYAKKREVFGTYQSSTLSKALRVCAYMLSRPWSKKAVFLRLGVIARMLLSFPVVVHASYRGEKIDLGFREFISQFFKNMELLESIPDCDLNIATWWMTAYPVLMSGKGKPVYFIQHYEEVFYGHAPEDTFSKLMCRMSYELPLYQIGNSSWIQKVIREKHGREIPFSNNALDTSCFEPRPKLSQKDGIIRVITYSRADDWKGFCDAYAIIAEAMKDPQLKIEWHVFGYEHDDLKPENNAAPYHFHKGLSFKDLAKLYAESDIALCCSWYESFPLPPLEAMSSGTAVVTTAAGTEDYAHHLETAMVMPSRDVDLGLKYLRQLIQDKDLRNRLEKNGLLKAKEYTWDRAVDVREKLLLEALKNPESSPGLRTGFRDESGVLYTQMPKDLAALEGKTVRSRLDHSVWAIEGGRRQPSMSEGSGDSVIEVEHHHLLRIPLRT